MNCTVWPAPTAAAVGLTFTPMADRECDEQLEMEKMIEIKKHEQKTNLSFTGSSPFSETANVLTTNKPTVVGPKILPQL
jgi:hypothetical protein